MALGNIGICLIVHADSLLLAIAAALSTRCRRLSSYKSGRWHRYVRGLTKSSHVSNNRR